MRVKARLALTVHQVWFLCNNFLFLPADSISHLLKWADYGSRFYSSPEYLLLVSLPPSPPVFLPLRLSYFLSSPDNSALSTFILFCEVFFPLSLSLTQYNPFV